MHLQLLPEDLQALYGGEQPYFPVVPHQDQAPNEDPWAGTALELEEALHEADTTRSLHATEEVPGYIAYYSTYIIGTVGMLYISN